MRRIAKKLALAVAAANDTNRTAFVQLLQQEPGVLERDLGQARELAMCLEGVAEQ